MAKRGYPGGRGGAMGGGNMQNILKQAQQMQKQMEEAQENLGEMEFEASSGGGMVTAKVKGTKKLVSVKISPEAVDPDDIEILEDMVVAAIREAMEKADREAQEKMGKFTGGMSGMPGLF
jgi:DNA-binding YbaB/EbfC family protein